LLVHTAIRAGERSFLSADLQESFKGAFRDVQGSDVVASVHPVEDERDGLVHRNIGKKTLNVEGGDDVVFCRRGITKDFEEIGGGGKAVGFRDVWSEEIVESLSGRVGGGRYLGDDRAQWVARLVSFYVAVCIPRRVFSC